MKRVIAILAICLMLPSPSKSVEVDKIAHFSASYVACDLLYKSMEFGQYLKKGRGELHIGHRIMVAALVNAIGYAKETRDPHYDKGDIRANALGSALWLLKMQVRF